MLQCLESFVVDVATICKMLKDVVRAINVEIQEQIHWPIGNQLLNVMTGFQQYSSLLTVAKAIVNTHFQICKPSLNFEDYLHFKSFKYIIQCQVVVDVKRRFLDIAIGMS